eukprot:7380675-Prymnesium_polylepis.1
MLSKKPDQQNFLAAPNPPLDTVANDRAEGKGGRSACPARGRARDCRLLQALLDYASGHRRCSRLDQHQPLRRVWRTCRLVDL